jgi:type IV fimbrial biogenesis protein FimT
MRYIQHGFTLIEALVAIAIMAILLAVAVPSFSSSGLNSELRSAAGGLLASANLARAEAIKRNAVVNLCVSSNGTTCGTGGWEQGWIVVAPASGALGETILQRHEARPAGFKISASAAIATVSFQPTGVGATPVAFTICRATPSPGQQERIVTIDAAGRVTSRRTSTGSCS